MDYDQINHDTSALDDAMRAARDRDRMGARAILTRARASLLGASVIPALIAGTAFVAAACAAAWIMRPHFDFHTVAIDVPKLVEKQVDAPKLVYKEVEVPKLVERTVEVPKIVEKPVEVPRMAELPSKTPDRAERRFISRPDYLSADYHGRLVRPDGNEIKFEDGKQFWPVVVVNGMPQRGTDGQFRNDYSRKFDVDGYIGDYAYCNKRPDYPELVYCSVIHNDHVESIVTAPYNGSGA
jgi:hypothetical protein